MYDGFQASARRDATPTGPALKLKGLNNVLMQLRKVCLHPLLLQEDKSGGAEGAEEVYDLASDEGARALARLVACSGKFLFLHRLLPKLFLFHHKVLIFSQMTKNMDLIELYLNAVGIPNLRLDGNTKV
jgi:SNF2 family DNA or RNA helicase